MDDATLKAAGFSDREIQLHKAGFSDAEIQAATKPATLGSTLVRAAQNLPGDIADSVGKLAKSTSDNFKAVTADPLAHWADNFKAVGDATSSAVDIAKGGLQHVRDMSPAAYQGDAPRMDTTAYDNFADANYQKYGTKQNVYKTVGDHPAGAALAAASIAVPALRGLGLDDAIVAGAGKVASAVPSVGRIVAPVAKAVDTVAGVGGRTKAASAAMRAETQDAVATAQANAATRAKRAADLAQTSGTQRSTLAARQSVAASQATPPTPAFAPESTLSEMGDSVRGPAIAQQNAIETSMKAADEKYRAAMQAVADDRAKTGVGVSDTPTAKVLIAQSENRISPNPITRPDVGPVPVSGDGGKLHADLVNTLKPQRTPLTKAEALQAKAAGNTVYKSPDGSLYRETKPNLEAVDNFRRFVGKVAQGNVEGYGAVNTIEARKMYDGLTKAIGEYVDGANGPVQQNWREAKQKLDAFDNVRTGQALVGTQPGTGVASVPAASIPGRLLVGGRDTMQQAAAVAGEAPIAALKRSMVQNALSGVKGSDAIMKAVGPSSKLGDVVASDDALTAAVKEYMGKTQAAEAQGAQAASLGQRVNTVDKRTKQLQAVADTLQGKASGYAADLVDLQNASPKQVGAQYTKMLEKAYADGTIDINKYQQGKQFAARAEKDFALKTTRDKWLAGAAGLLGASQVPKAFHAITGVLNH